MGFLTVLTGMAQQNVSKVLTWNKIRFTLNTLGPAFHQNSNHTPSFHDLDKGADYIYASNMWIGGKSANGQLKLAGETYSTSHDWTTGPISLDPNAASEYNHVYTMTNDIITDFKTNFGQSGYVIPQEILDWPGSGVVANGEPSVMAPYKDLNSNGVYEPNLGDYPIIKGDMAAFIIRNDKVLHAETGSEALVANFYIMYYAFKPSADALERSVFVDYTIVNRSTQIYNDVFFGVWTDFDLGNPQDDFIGSIVDKEGVYCYNGDGDDEVTGGLSPGFGVNPPSIGQFFLSNSIEYSMSYAVGGGATGDPTNGMEYYKYLSGLWRDNASIVYGGNGHYDTGSEPGFPVGALDKPCRYMFPGTSDPTGRGTDGSNYGQTTSWDENSAANAPGDRRILSSVKLGNLYHEVPVTISTVYVADNYVRDAIDVVRVKALGINNSTVAETFVISPNPAGDFLYISGVKGDNVTAEILDLTGRVQLISEIKDRISTESLSNGTYLIRMVGSDGSVTGSQKLLICR